MKTSSVPVIVTVDGPAASGKTTVSRLLAARHGWSWVSTGAFYRGLGFVAREMGLPLDDEARIATLCHSSDWAVRMGHDRTEVFFRGTSVTEQIHTDEVGSIASAISKFPLVRAHLLQAQRNCVLNVTGLVAEGRDCGTVVFPEAHVKFFLTASAEDRAHRRAAEHGGQAHLLQQSQLVRDTQDSQRTVAPMKMPENGHLIDSTGKSILDVVEQLEQIVRKALAVP